MSMTSLSGRRHPPIAFSLHPASRCNPSRSTSTPSFADHAATRRDSVGCEGRCPALPSGAVPARSAVASRSAGSSRSSVASLWSRRPCPASSSSVRASRPCECRIRRPSRSSGRCFARNRRTLLRLSSSRPVSAPRIPRDPVLAGPDPDRPVEAERCIHYLHPRRDGWRVLVIRSNTLNLKHLPPHVAPPHDHS